MKSFLIGFKDGFRSFGNIVALAVNTVLLSTVYVVALGLTSLFARLRKKDFLDISGSGKESYWRDLNLEKREMERYYRQF